MLQIRFEYTKIYFVQTMVKCVPTELGIKASYQKVHDCKEYVCIIKYYYFLLYNIWSQSFRT